MAAIKVSEKMICFDQDDIVIHSGLEILFSVSGSIDKLSKVPDCVFCEKQSH